MKARPSMLLRRARHDIRPGIAGDAPEPGLEHAGERGCVCVEPLGYLQSVQEVLGNIIFQDRRVWKGHEQGGPHNALPKVTQSLKVC